MGIKLSNIPLRKFRGFLEQMGLKHIKTTGGHEKWVRSDLNRPIIIQSHIDPVPEFIVRNCLKTIKASIKDLIDYIGN